MGKYMRLFAKTYPDVEFVQQGAAQLPWFHFVALISKIKDDKAKTELHSVDRLICKE